MGRIAVSLLEAPMTASYYFAYIVTARHTPTKAKIHWPFYKIQWLTLFDTFEYLTHLTRVPFAGKHYIFHKRSGIVELQEDTEQKNLKYQMHRL
jgi:hypothetical protein